MTLTTVRKKLDKKKAEYNHVCSQIEDEEAALEKAIQETKDGEQAQSILQHLAQEIQSTAHSRIASIVTKCLESVFPDDPYEFQIQFERKRGKTEANLLLVRGGLILDDPIRQAGGGVIDIASFALRLTCIVLSHPQKRRLLVMDEPFKMLSVEFRPAIRAMLDTLAQELNVQIIIVTHAPELADDNSIIIGG